MEEEGAAEVGRFYSFFLGHGEAGERVLHATSLLRVMHMFQGILTHNVRSTWGRGGVTQEEKNSYKGRGVTLQIRSKGRGPKMSSFNVLYSH